MSNKTLEHGTLKGLKCPYCPVVAQRLERDGNALGGLSQHMSVCHPELYEKWVETWR